MLKVWPSSESSETTNAQDVHGYRRNRAHAQECYSQQTKHDLVGKKIGHQSDASHTRKQDLTLDQEQDQNT